MKLKLMPQDWILMGESMEMGSPRVVTAFEEGLMTSGCKKRVRQLS